MNIVSKALCYLAHQVLLKLSPTYRKSVSYPHITYHSGAPRHLLFGHIFGLQGKSFEFFDDLKLSEPDRARLKKEQEERPSSSIIEPAEGLIISRTVMLNWYRHFAFYDRRLRDLDPDYYETFWEGEQRGLIDPAALIKEVFEDYHVKS